MLISQRQTRGYCISKTKRHIKTSISCDIDMHAMDVHVCESRQHLAQSPWRVAEEPIFADVDSERLRTLGVLNTHTHTHTHV
jgi:hypothetical protein